MTFGFAHPEPYPDFPLTDVERKWLDAEADRRAHHALRVAYAAGADDMQRAVLDHLSTLPAMPDAAERAARVERIAAERLEARRAAIDDNRRALYVERGRDPDDVYTGGKIETDWVDGLPWHVRRGYRCRGSANGRAGCSGLVIFGLDSKWHHYIPEHDNDFHRPYPSDDDPLGTDL